MRSSNSWRRPGCSLSSTRPVKTTKHATSTRTRARIGRGSSPSPNPSVTSTHASICERPTWSRGQEWTGWHAIEKDLWPPADGYNGFTDAQRIALADQLVADTVDLAERTKDITFTAPQLGNGAKELLDEVATGKVTGEEEIWSHTDLWDFQANIDGARTAFEALKPALEQKDKTLAVTLTERFARVQDLLDQHREGDGFVLYTTLTADQIKQLADAVNALGEPLAELTAAVVL